MRRRQRTATCPTIDASMRVDEPRRRVDGRCVIPERVSGHSAWGAPVSLLPELSAANEFFCSSGRQLEIKSDSHLEWQEHGDARHAGAPQRRTVRSLNLRRSDTGPAPPCPRPSRPPPRRAAAASVNTHRSPPRNLLLLLLLLLPFAPSASAPPPHAAPSTTRRRCGRPRAAGSTASRPAGSAPRWAPSPSWAAARRRASGSPRRASAVPRRRSGQYRARAGRRTRRRTTRRGSGGRAARGSGGRKARAAGRARASAPAHL
jgi:hypothetical protein